ncbi:MAG: ABC transporter [Proteobacteria bacterium]|nr:MAG: ABC transporter [Pseudomonadota bacterium]
MREISKIVVLSLTILSACSAASAQEVYDPLEPMNRGIFWFNNKLDIYLLEPVAKGYDWIMPQEAQDSVGNFFSNLRSPALLVSDLVQLKFDQAATHTGRFLINTTIGLGGLFDIASEMGLEEHDEDFGTALAYHGVPEGPYLVLPILGPSNFRDGFGRLVDGFLDPVFYLGATDMHDDTALAIQFGLKGLQVIDTRAGLIDAVEAARESSVDYYLFIQGAYHQHRRGVIYDGNPPEEEFEFDDVDGETGSVDADKAKEELQEESEQQHPSPRGSFLPE